ncbi:hypothetical protein IMZ48_19205 [Candidatus Bathyarchaeota archaeon]|nr:hypothetical protein [Candidatus Bathyarchaeota archaeon]
MVPAPDASPPQPRRRSSSIPHTSNPELFHALASNGLQPEAPPEEAPRRRRPSSTPHTEHPELGGALRRVSTNTRTLWDRRVDGGFPEVKELKRRVRDVVEPGRDLGHVDGKKAVHEVKTCEVGCKDCQ